MIGPLSNSVGRRRPLLAGTNTCLLASIVCVVAPNIEVLVAARFVQGFSGAAGVVLARAIVTDVTSGPGTVKLMNVMMIIGGIMPVIAPTIGGGILQFVDCEASSGRRARLRYDVRLHLGLAVRDPERAGDCRHWPIQPCSA